MLKKRYLIFFSIITILFSFLIIKIFYYQLLRGNNLLEAASAQRITNFDIEKPRGDILDRNGIPFTNRKEKFSIVLKPLYLKGQDKELEKVCRILELNFYSIRREIESKKVPLVFDTDEVKKDLIMELNIQGVSSINSLERYNESSLAKHILGYLNMADSVGNVGIEKEYEDVLSYDGKSTIGIITDAQNNPVQGLGYRLFKNSKTDGKLNVKLTLDYHIQKIVEDVMERRDISGAVVVEDVLNGDIIGIASKPDYDQTRVEDYLESSEKELFNRAVAAYNLGSIFKIVDTALLFESGLSAEEGFYCPGYVEVGNKRFKCPSYGQGGHGWINLRRAFAVSCNSYFINAGLNIGYESLIRKAESFGLGRYTGVVEQGIIESPGNLPEYNVYYSDGDIANISIGQGKIMATPLQVANMTATVANGGIRNKINIVDSITDEDGKKVRDVRDKNGERIIEKNVADKIKSLMEAVTSVGTGTRASLEHYGGAAGKTGSAETGDEDVVHAWFTGYFPKRNPKYAMTVFVEDGESGGGTAAPVFAEIAEEIMKKGF